MPHAEMHASLFSYTITRPYPFKWFTPVAVIGGLLAAVLISFLSIATQGYQIVAVYTPDPNTTHGTPNFFGDWPLFMTENTRSSCSPTTIPIGGEFYTNNTALKDTLSSAWQGDSASSPQNLLGSLPYRNNVLQDCSVRNITVNVQGLERTAMQIAIQQWGVILTASITCGIDSSDGPMMMDLMTTYNFNPPDGWHRANFPLFPGRNESSKASLWWGETLLAWNYIALTNDLQLANEIFPSKANPAVYKGTIGFTRTSGSVPSNEAIRSLGFFDAVCFFAPFGVAHRLYSCRHDDVDRLDMVSHLVHAGESDPEAPLPGIWISADSLSKAFYFTILADLGQRASGPSILVDPELLAHFTQNITSIRDRITSDNGTWGENLDMGFLQGLAHDPYTGSSNSHLGILPSVLSTTYLCQVPRLKSTPTLVVSVLINNIVLLSTI
jgi:hypothetical protein